MEIYTRRPSESSREGYLMEMVEEAESQLVVASLVEVI